MMSNNIRKIRKASGLSLEVVARLCNTTKATIMKLEKGPQSGGMQLTLEWMRKVSRALKVEPRDLIGEIKDKVRVLGYVGAGEEVFAIDDHSMGASIEEVDPPTGYFADGIVAVRVKGDSMEPQLEDGWLIFYKKIEDGVPYDCIGELCVVKLENDGMLVKKIRNGSALGLYHLLSKNPQHQPLFDQKLQWAAKVIDIRPR